MVNFRHKVCFLSKYIGLDFLTKFTGTVPAVLCAPVTVRGVSGGGQFSLIPSSAGHTDTAHSTLHRTDDVRQHKPKTRAVARWKRAQTLATAQLSDLVIVIWFVAIGLDPSACRFSAVRERLLLGDSPSMCTLVQFPQHHTLVLCRANVRSSGCESTSLCAAKANVSAED